MADSAGPLILFPGPRERALAAHAALADMAAEIAALGARIWSDDASPGGGAGIVAAVNRALALARDQGMDAILLDPDARPTGGAFAEMAAVAAIDPLTCVVGARTDGAPIAGLHRTIAPLLPRLTYAPTIDGPCVLVRAAMLREFGLFDESYGTLADARHDFVRRCNRRGYRAVLANHAFVGGGPAVPAPDPALTARWPEFPETIRRWHEGADARAQRALGGLAPEADGRLRFLFDARKMGPFFAGTFEHARALIAAFAARHADRFAIDVLASREAAAFHRLDGIAGVGLPDPDTVRPERPYAIAFRIDQPFALHDVTSLSALGAITGALVLDTIAMDCQQLDGADLASVWQALVDTTALIGFNSDFTRDQFRRRFPLPPGAVEFVSRCSTDVADYRRGAVGEAAHILLVGNHYPHKHVVETLAAIRAAAPDAEVRVLGVAVPDEPGVRGYAAGGIPQADVDALYDEASVIVFPSHYEGFGLPIMHALARGRPVIARDTPPAREIAANTPYGRNVHLAPDTAAIAALAVDAPGWDMAKDAVAAGGWAEAAAALADACERAIARFDYDAARRRHARAIVLERMLDARAHAEDADARTRAAEAARDVSDRLLTALATPLPVAIMAPSSRKWFGARPIDIDTRRMTPEALVKVLLDRPVASGRVRLRTDRDISAPLRAAGYVAVRFERGIVEATPVADWRAILPGPGDDGDFVRLAFLVTLGREPDAEAAAHYARELAAGRSRVAILRDLYLSGERRARMEG